MKTSILQTKQALSCCLAVMLLGSIVSCGSSDDTKSGKQTDAQGTQGTVVTEDPKRQLYADIAPVAEDLGGYAFRITASENNELTYDQVQWDADEENGDTLNDAIYRRNLAVEEAYNCTISLNVTAEDDEDFARTHVLAGDDFTDLMVINLMSGATDLAMDGCFLNLNNIPELNMDAPWWDQAIRDLAIYNKQYVTAGAITIKDDLSQLCVLYSKTLANRYDIDNLYEHVLNGTWTWELMKSLCKDTYADLDGDGEMGAYDLYGMIADDDGPYFMAIGAEMDPISYDEESDSYVTTWMSDEVFTKISDYLDFMITNPGVIISTSDRAEETFGDEKYVTNVFKEDRALFFATPFGGSVSCRDMETDFGLLPTPKWNEEQESYCCAVVGRSAPLVMPITIVDQHAAGLITEALAYESMFRVTPAFYDVFIDSKILRDEESLAVVDLMFASKKYDLDWQLDITGIDRFIDDMAIEHRSYLVKLLAQREKSVEKTLEKYIEKYEDLE